MGTYHQISQRSSGQASQYAAFWSAADLARWLPFAIFYSLLANIPFWAASHWLGIFQNGWICLDYIAAGAIALFVPRILGVALLLLAIGVDVLAAVCQTYFLTAAECLANLGAVHRFAGYRLLAGAGIALLIVLFIAIAASFPVASIQKNYRMRTAMCLVAFAAILVSMDGVTILLRHRAISKLQLVRSSSKDTIRTNFFTERRLSRIPTYRLVSLELFDISHRKWMSSFPSSSLPIRSAAAEAIGSSGLTLAKDSQAQPNLVVIVVESWGLDNESSVRNALIAAYNRPDLTARYQVLQGTVPFYGPTVAGEARELCGNMMGFHLLEASSQELQGCLPGRLAALGYRGVALHGMEGHMFDRSAWYKTIGFQEILFKEQLEQQGLPDCLGVFTGTCDAAVAKWMERRLETRKANPEFLYWMTLNSHLPVLVPAPLKDGAPCSLAPPLAEHPALCSWYQLVANLHQSVADLAMSNLGRPTVIAIVGDHAPPFSDPVLRDRFSSAVVPYIVLVPRRQSGHAEQTMNLEGK